jgi:hypothetical protein
MQNFGRGMWRRVGDYDRVRVPMIEQQVRIEQLQQYILYQRQLKIQEALQKQSLNRNNMNTVVGTVNNVKKVNIV